MSIHIGGLVAQLRSSILFFHEISYFRRMYLLFSGLLKFLNRGANIVIRTHKLLMYQYFPIKSAPDFNNMIDQH